MSFEQILGLITGYLEKLSFCPISSLCSKNYPRHIQYMPAVIFFACLDLAQKSLFFKVAYRDSVRVSPAKGPRPAL
jgi:hypothetical protein